MKKECEKCGRALAADGEALICVYECTFCRDCSDSMNSICPNCGGELAARGPGKQNQRLVKLDCLKQSSFSGGT